jgi:plasmid maintenance system antidote protein VapI
MTDSSTSVASEALKTMLGERNLKATLAADLEVGPDRLSKWLAGAEQPLLRFAVAIEDMLGLSPKFWEEPPTPRGIDEAIRDASERRPDGIAELRKRAEKRREKDVA